LSWMLSLALAGALGGDAPPNVLFLLADDQRRDALGAAGNECLRTPHLDSLAARGLRFRRAYCMGSIHGAVCQPSRAMLMSGRTLYRVPMDLHDVPLLPEVLGRAGYRTFGTGKWHNGRDSFRRAFQEGRSVFHGGMSDHEQIPVQDLDGQGGWTEVRTASRFSSEEFTDAFLTWLDTVDGDRPFFAYVAFTAPHDPRQPPEPYRGEYAARLPDLPRNFLPQHPFQNGWLTGRDETLLPWPRPPRLVREQLGEYYGMIAHLDAQVGRILAALADRGLDGNTIIVYTADHGLALGSHGLLGKQNLYEHSMGTPLILAGPGIRAGVSDALVYLLDLFPTLCGLLDVPVPAGVEGRDLSPVLRGDAAGVRDTLFTTYEDIQRAVCDQEWKLIHYPKIARTQLFHLATDPDEMHDLSRDPEQADRVWTMLEWIADWQRRVADPHPLHVAAPMDDRVDLTGRPRKPDRHQPAWIVEKYFGH